MSRADVPRPVGPYRPAVSAGLFVFISGQIPVDPGTGLVTAHDIRAQTERALRNLESVLESVGLDRSHVVKTTLFMVDLTEFEAMNEIYGSTSGTYSFHATVPSMPFFDVRLIGVAGVAVAVTLIILKKKGRF